MEENKQPSLEELMAMVKKFRDDRDWKQYHTPKDLAISVSLEASELLEIFQWSRDELWQKERIGEIKEELADVLIYAMMLADILEIDIGEIIPAKLAKNAGKYPAPGKEE